MAMPAQPTRLDRRKARTRRALVDAARRIVADRGTTQVSIQDITDEADVGFGSFYNHFESKDDLAREAVAKGWQGTRERLEQVLNDPEHGGIEALINSYLSPRHRENMAAGCVAAALSPEIARGADIVRAEFTRGIEEVVSLLADALPRTLKPRQRRTTAMALFSILVGTLAMSRAVDDAEASDDILAAGRKAALAMVPSK